MTGGLISCCAGVQLSEAIGRSGSNPDNEVDRRSIQLTIMVVVAQLVEQDPVKVCVAGSSPVYHPKNSTPARKDTLCCVEHESSMVMTQNSIDQSKTPFGGVFIGQGFEEVIFPAIWEEDTFTDKVGAENSNMMWRFPDKKGRDVCLVPEITGMAQNMWNTKWSKERSEYNIFYVQKCYRYERPQRGRYREFTQIGIEMLGQDDPTRAIDLLRECLDTVGVDYELDLSAMRGLSYYTEEGFEARIESLGAQKQIAGGGRYPEGVGWAVGLDRLMLALEP